MNKRAIIAMAAVLLLLSGGILWGGGLVRDKFLEMHGMKRHAMSKEPAKRTEALAHEWLAAFASGEDAMRAFLTKNIAAEALANRTIEQRMDGYRTLRKRFGTLKVKEILSSSSGTVEMLLVASDRSEHEFIFTAQTSDPFKLLSIALREVHYGHG
jgi:hypothetical protein